MLRETATLCLASRSVPGRSVPGRSVPNLGRRIPVLLAVLALPALLSACGGSDEKTVIVNPPPAGGGTVIVPPSGATRVCPAGQTTC